jgi:hypothetical protein
MNGTEYLNDSQDTIQIGQANNSQNVTKMDKLKNNKKHINK